MVYELGIEDVQTEDSTIESVPAETGTVEGQSNPVVTNGTTEPQMFEYSASGKTVKEDIDTILKRASQGYNYAQHIEKHKSDVTSFEQERDGHLSKYGQWKQYHDYATENPDWAEFVRGQWDQRQSFGQPSANPEGSIEQAEQISPEVKSFMDEYRNDKRLRQEADEDAALNESIQTVQKEFPEVDLSHTDPETGTSLEMRVLDHARANGINSFKAAFKDMMFDDLMAKKVTAAKEAAAKEIADRHKKGFISESDTSLNTPSPQQRKGGSSYQDLIMTGAQELGFLT